MAHMVFCTKYKQEMEGLDEPPFDSDFGQKIYKNVSKKAWGEWVERQKMLLNEYRLQPWTREAQDFLVEQMNGFFFGEGEGGSLPKEYMVYHFLHHAQLLDTLLPMQNRISGMLPSSWQQQHPVLLSIHVDIEQTHFEQNQLL